MEDLIYFVTYGLYIVISSALAFPLLKRKAQHPQSLNQIVTMVFFNSLVLGVLPLVTFLMKFPPKPPISASERYDYYEKKRIWIWNK